MLDKDQYNQEEYNDYYQQEIRGAETSGEEDEDSSKGKSKLLVLLGLLILGVAGYFGYKTVIASDNNVTNEEILSIEANKIDKETSQITTKAKDSNQISKEEENKSQVNSVISNIETAINEEQKMSPEEIAKVVQMVMSQMNNKIEKTEQISKISNDKSSVEDKNLISSLSGTDVDLVKSEDEDKKLEESLNSIEETTKDNNINKDSAEVNTYNKVKVEENSGEDELSKLSSQISSLISDKKSSNQTNGSTKEEIYTESLKKEVVTRKNEMRIIVVRKGDTLGRIAKRAYGNVMEYKKIYKANPDILKRPDRIYIGQKLRIPK